MTDKKKKTQAGDSDRLRTLADILTLAGDPLPIDPNTDEIDPEKLTDAQRAALKEYAETMAAALDAYLPIVTAKLQNLTTAIQNISKNMPNSDKLGDKLGEMVQRARKTWQPYFDLYDEKKDLEPYIKAELTKPEYAGKIFDDIMDNPIELLKQRQDPNSDIYKVFEAAKAAKAAAGSLLQVKYATGTELQTSTDKLPNTFFSYNAPKSKLNGQREMLQITQEEMIPLKYEKTNAPPITLFYDFYYNEKQLQNIGITNGFDSYDYFITAVLDNLILDGNDTVSLTKVWHELGNTGSPSPERLTDLYKRLVRGMTTIITIDDREVKKAWGYGKDNDAATYKEIISPIMPLQIIGEKFVANGNVAKAQLRITGLSPFFVLSQNIGHFTTWKKEILRLYTGRKTPRYYTVLQYLMTQIAWIRNPHSTRNNKITYQELYDYAGDKGTRQQQLTRDMAYRLLDEVFIPAGYVKSYKEDNNGKPGIKIKCTKNTAALLPNKKK